MKKIICVFIAILTFGISVSIYYLRPLVMPVSLYTISQSAPLYRFNDVHMKAYLESSYSDDDFVYLPVTDFNNGDAVFAGFDLNDSLKENNALLKLKSELFEMNSKLDRKHGEYVAQVEIIGRIEELNSCFGPSFGIQVKEIKQISPILYVSNENGRYKLISNR